MSDQTQHSSGNGNSNTALAFILGAVVVALAVVGWFVLSGENPVDKPDISIELPGGGVIEGEVEGGGN
ncbi:hypothetical protein [Phaeobacter sp. B1627]|uniref:hypothetical protein n=1 Tax=Phaeobacter sp. B1627 TaxID=2583809 RepID=UPI00111B65F0|nr:hypothetical protein [Phaeobacter sp. B1627]TNJ40868.1 hypothetical protein FGE21_16160 [Phaeobacter sp. B1627]